jgi:hypothetical protein
MSSSTSTNPVEGDVVPDPQVLPRGTETASGPEPQRAPNPFVWQHGRQLILLDDDPMGWVMAELRFDDELLHYVEVRRAVYPLTREAIGAVISRALASGDHAAVDTALSLHDWLSTYYGIDIVSDFIASPDARSVEFTV